MGRKASSITVPKMPDAGCAACNGFGVIRMTAHFHSGDSDWEAQCWECFGDVKFTLPHPPPSEM